MASEGYPFILFSGFTTLTLALLGYSLPTLVCLVLTAFITWFFRDPSRVLPEEDNAIVCPADGKVIQIREMEDTRFLNTKVIRISIFMNVFNVHVNRIPLSGTVERVLLKPGRFYAADKEKAALQNEYCAMTIRTGNQRLYGVVQIAGLIARRIICRAEKGDQVTAGQRYGLIRFGSRVDLYLPLDTEVTVSEGQKVRCGETILGFLD